MTAESETSDGLLAGRAGVAVSAVVGVAAALLSYLWAQGQTVAVETLFRVQPTVEGGGVGSDWNAGNTDPMLDAMIAIIHAVDVIMGVAILVMVFLHWAAFRRLASRMRRPGEGPASEAVATDGGDAATSGGDRQ